MDTLNLEPTIYRADECAAFNKTGKAYGGFSNFAGSYVSPVDGTMQRYSLCVEGATIHTAEALYQACRFPDHPAIQREIIEQVNPRAAKLKSKKTVYKPAVRLDWESVCIPVMRWCLRVKLAQHFEAFGGLLAGTGERPIVERVGVARGRRGGTAAFWGAVEDEGDPRIMCGVNVLGQLLMELREELRVRGPAMRQVEPPAQVPHFLLYGQPIGLVGGQTSGSVITRLAGEPGTPCACCMGVA
jgi:predicted NAD-dependent protein-ADP-ribosyltransferase YbiA (DUF1768 family)